MEPRKASDHRDKLERERTTRLRPLIAKTEEALDGKRVEYGNGLAWRIEYRADDADGVSELFAMYTANGYIATVANEPAPGEPRNPPACKTCHGVKTIHRSVTHEDVTCTGCSGSGKQPIKMIPVMYLSLPDDEGTRRG
jgi:hypothetical protein